MSALVRDRDVDQPRKPTDGSGESSLGYRFWPEASDSGAIARCGLFLTHRATQFTSAGRNHTAVRATWIADATRSWVAGFQYVLMKFDLPIDPALYLVRQARCLQLPDILAEAAFPRQGQMEEARTSCCIGVCLSLSLMSVTRVGREQFRRLRIRLSSQNVAKPWSVPWSEDDAVQNIWAVSTGVAPGRQ